MRRLQIKEAEVMKLAIQDEITRSEESRYDHRLHGILLICQGLSCTQVAELFGHSARTVQYWVRSFERGGFAGLREKPRHGRPPSLDEKTMLKVGEDLRRSPMDFGYVQNLWDGKLLSHHLAAHYGVHLGVRQCQRIFNQLESRRRKPRSLIAEADPKRHKKTDPSGKKR